MLVSDVAVKDQVMVCVIRLSGFFDWLFVGVHGGPHRCCLDELNLQIKLYSRQQTKLYYFCFNTYLSVKNRNLFLMGIKKPTCVGL